ncbi:hypothetical protein ACFVW2_11390 [Streptomyces sp. NPDC058171]
MRTRLTTWRHRTLTHLRGPAHDRGAGFVEYAGLLIIIAGIFTLIDGLGLDGMISDRILKAVNDVIGG